MSAFEADRFNRSRTSPRRTADFVTARSFVRKRRGTQDFACGLPASHSLSLTPANRLNFNRSRTSPRRIICDIQVLRPQRTRTQDFACGLPASRSLSLTPANRLNFNRSRASPRRTADFVTARSFVRKGRGLRISSCGLAASRSLSLTPANRLNFNRSRTSPEQSLAVRRWSLVSPPKNPN